jgi:hypothetical protein
MAFPIKKNSLIPKLFFMASTEEFLGSFSEHDFLNEAILIKGSRDFSFERITALLEQKVHQTVMEIDLNALVNNLNYYKSKLKPGVKIAVVVKAFSYGIGSWEIANLCSIIMLITWLLHLRRKEFPCESRNYASNHGHES